MATMHKSYICIYIYESYFIIKSFWFNSSIQDTIIFLSLVKTNSFFSPHFSFISYSWQFEKEATFFVPYLNKCDKRRLKGWWRIASKLSFARLKWPRARSLFTGRRWPPRDHAINFLDCQWPQKGNPSWDIRRSCHTIVDPWTQVPSSN